MHGEDKDLVDAIMSRRHYMAVPLRRHGSQERGWRDFSARKAAPGMNDPYATSMSS